MPSKRAASPRRTSSLPTKRRPHRSGPRGVSNSKDERHHIFDWKVPLEVGGQRVAVLGSLDYPPPPASTFSLILIVPLAVLALLGGLAWWLRRESRSS
jgi:hypothetical protein